jgi:hypothetical protein
VVNFTYRPESGLSNFCNGFKNQLTSVLIFFNLSVPLNACLTYSPALIGVISSSNMRYIFSGYFAFFEMIAKKQKNIRKYGKGVVLRAQKLRNFPLG